MFRAEYEWEIIEDVLVIYDKNLGGKSVTNDIENILPEINEKFAIPDHVIYLDTEGNYDQILTDGIKFVDFGCLREADRGEAIKKVKGE